MCFGLTVYKCIMFTNCTQKSHFTPQSVTKVSCFYTGQTMGERVKSKNLFNFKPQGFIDEDIVAFDLKMKTEYNIDPDVIDERMQKLSEAEFVAELRF